MPVLVDNSFPAAILRDSGLELEEKQIQQINAYIRLLLDYNRQVNLTAITEVGEIWRKHVLDSFLIFYALRIPEGVRVIDIGTGGGIPGIFLKIYRPDLHLTLLEAQQKKIKFLEEVVDRICLTGVKCLWERAETAARRQEYRERFTLAVARGVAPLNTLAEYCLPFVHVGGHMVAYKGPGGKNELAAANRAINLLGGGQTNIWQGQLWGGEEKRTLVIIEKINATPVAYPRRPGIPAKKPL